MTPAVPLADLADFSDRLSPMVVKELRQGLRTRVFRTVLLVLHLLLVILTLIAGAARNPDEVKWLLDGLSTLALCVALPLCGFSALAEEIRSKTLETLVLTRLSAARIVFGKWASLALQSLLIALSLTPYVVARYGFGGVELIAELSGLAGKWLAGLVISAGIVCLSTQRQFWVRAVVVALFLMGPGMLSMAFLAASSISGSSMGRITGAFGISLGAGLSAGTLAFAAIAAAAWCIFFLLSLAATRIAPAASHLAVIKRTVHAFTVLVLLGLATQARAVSEGLVLAAAMVGSFASMDALIEMRNEVPSLLIPFYRRGWPGRLAAWLLTPGWPNGVFYSVTLAVAITLGALALEDLEMAARAWLTMAGTWLCALILHSSSARRWQDMLAPYLGISLFVSIVQSLLMLVTQNPLTRYEAPWVGLLLPGTAEPAIVNANSAGYGDAAVLRLAAMLCNSLWLLLLLLLAAWSLRQTRHVRAEGRLLAGMS